MRNLTQPEVLRDAARVVLVALVLAGCGSTPAATVRSSATAATAASPPMVVSPAAPSSVVPSAAAPSARAAATLVDGPPSGRLSAEGGDPVVGQLGTYTWADGGSDSPWLPGAPIELGAGEPLTVSFEPTITTEGWQARSVPSTAAGPDGATVLGMGSGAPTFPAPGAGSWTIEVHVTFGDGAGDASYFWRLDVR
jgi:hypothetical protein